MKQAILYQRIEAALIFLASLYFYHHLNFNIWLFVLFLFSIDIFMLGYLKNSKVGAYVYNFGHSMIVPAILVVIGTAGNYRLLLAVGLIWIAHVGCDRALGYGLKYESGFKHTHLGHIGNNNKSHNKQPN